MREADGDGRAGGRRTGSGGREHVEPEGAEREPEAPVRGGDAPERERPVPVPESDAALLAECRIETFRAGGPGGQHQNTTESAVRLVHLPTGTRVIARDERSQHRNRALALDRLRRALEERNREQAPRIETRVPRAERRKRLEQKRRRGQKKRLRRPPEPDAE